MECVICGSPYVEGEVLEGFVCAEHLALALARMRQAIEVDDPWPEPDPAPFALPDLPPRW